MAYIGEKMHCTGITPVLVLVGMTCHTLIGMHTPNNTQFAFDFHGVVVQPVQNRVSDSLLSMRFISSIKLNRYLPMLAGAMIMLSYQGGTGEQYIKLLNDYHQPALAQLALDIANKQQPISETIAIIKHLKNLGYEVNMASDIGTLALQDFAAKEFEKPHSDQILPLFNHIYHVDYLKQSCPIHKPNPSYFTGYQQRYNSVHKPYVIFIDDKLKNVVGARDSGMIGIFFTTPSELRKNLIERGILKNE